MADICRAFSAFSTVLANRRFLDWRLFGQNPETDLELATMG